MENQKLDESLRPFDSMFVMGPMFIFIKSFSLQLYCYSGNITNETNYFIVIHFLTVCMSILNNIKL